MSLIRCKECNYYISDKSRGCPACGAIRIIGFAKPAVLWVFDFYIAMVLINIIVSGIIDNIK